MCMACQAECMEPEIACHHVTMWQASSRSLACPFPSTIPEWKKRLLIVYYFIVAVGTILWECEGLEEPVLQGGAFPLQTD